MKNVFCALVAASALFAFIGALVAGFSLIMNDHVVAGLGVFFAVMFLLFLLVFSGGPK